MLKLDSVSINFSGVKAVNEVSFELVPNTLTAVIGPNGAGKTTLFNLISGFYNPTHGKVFLDGADITNLPIHERVRMRMGRSFQITSLFPELTVAEHMIVATSRQSMWKLSPEAEERSIKVLHDVRLWKQKDIKAKDLSVPDQKKLDFAMMLAPKPKLLLLDEPFASLAPEQIDDLAEIVMEMSSHTTVLIVEHRLDLVMKIANRVIVMAKGTKIADGTPTEIRQNELVQRVYLKEDSEAS